MAQEQAPQQLQIELTPEVANGNYSNLAIINHSNQEFVLDFVAALPGLPQARVNSRQILTPESAKRLLFALQENVVNFEQQFGTIQLGVLPKQLKFQKVLVALPLLSVFQKATHNCPLSQSKINNIPLVARRWDFSFLGHPSKKISPSSNLVLYLIAKRRIVLEKTTYRFGKNNGSF